MHQEQLPNQRLRLTIQSSCARNDHIARLAITQPSVSPGIALKSATASELHRTPAKTAQEKEELQAALHKVGSNNTNTC